MKTYNENKISFIICSNNEQFLNECVVYLEQLIVPEGIQTELLIINDAKSMTAGYNEAMKASDAKYKVYLHQDTFIICRDFISNILAIFRENPRIGMIGMIGAEKLSRDGVMWHENRCGDFYNLDKMLEEGLEGIEKIDSGIRQVQVVDGLLMATQYDIPWREDILLGWDFYDVSQCLEFSRAGYEIVVPAQNPSWTNHRCGAPAYWNYEQSRQIVLREYPEIYQDNDYYRVLFVPSEKIVINGLAVGLALAGHKVDIWNRYSPLGDENPEIVSSLEENLEQGHYDVVVTYDFCVPVAIACHNMGVKYLSWVYDSPLFELYRKEAMLETNHIMVFDRKQYARMQEMHFPHLYYGTLATDVELYGALSLSEEDERKYSCDVSFVGRLYNRMRFDELFTNQTEEENCYREEANHIFSDCYCKWDECTTIFDWVSDGFVDFILRREPVEDWKKYCLREKFYVESFKLARQMNMIERTAVLNRLAEKYQVVLYTDDDKLESLPKVIRRPGVSYMEEMPKVFYCSKINLNITSRSIESGIPQRVFDIMAVGGFVLTNYQKELEEYFEIGKDLEVFHSLEELEQKVEYYLKHEEARVRIAINGYKKVRNHFSYTHCGAEMIRKIMTRR